MNSSGKKSASLLDQIEGMYAGILQVDAAWCHGRIETARRCLRNGQPIDRTLESLIDRCTASAKVCQQRKLRMPKPAYDPSLPIVSHRREIIDAIRSSRVLIIAGETGSGKTTQIPKMCIEAERGLRGLIGCTQPRRIAAQAMADRVAEELQSPLGELVGFQVRFRERLDRNGIVKFMTDGILLAETAHDRDFDQYDTIIIDEAHERSLNIDFLLGYLKQVLARREDLRVIITSATIDTEKFSRHFDDAPVLEVSGRGYPVQVEYQPLGDVDDSTPTTSRDLYSGIVKAVHRLSRVDAKGDILVFLSGEREIHEARDFLNRQGFRHTEVLPLYARLPVAEQRRVFHPGNARRIILSTNVAETSLTVPRIRFVIDSGFARISRYSHRSRVQRLPIEAVSQASANQRMGRCGRLGPGTCIRLYSEADFDLRAEFTEPEILRTSLASVILRMLTMGLGVVEEFPFLDPPAPRMISDAYHLLFELGAIDSERQPVDLGRRLSRWPVDVRLARMLLEGASKRCLNEVIVLVAALSIQDPRERPLEASLAADEAHGRFTDDKSDFVALQNLWAYLNDKRRDLSSSRFRKLCKREYLNWQRVNEWSDLVRQLRQQAREERLLLDKAPGSHEQVHRALLSGLLSHVGNLKPEDSVYIGSRSRTFQIFPGSGLFSRRPKWLMAAEIVETSKTWARTNAAIKPEWLESQAAHLLRFHHYDPHWSRKRGKVMAWEQVSLFGLVIVEKRRVDYGRINPAHARELFVSGALVAGQLDTRSGFMKNNRRVREEVEALEHKRRRHDVLVDDAVLFEYFDARVPANVRDAAGFEKWLKRLGQAGRRQLYIGHDLLIRAQAGDTPIELYPDTLDIGGYTLPLSYHFKPGDEADGVTISVPLDMLNTLDAGTLQWLVPGLLRDKITGLIRSLPKPLRRAFTPVPQFSDAALERLREQPPGPLLPALAESLQAISGIDCDAERFDESALPDYQRFRIEVVDERQQTVAVGRDLAQLQAQFGHQARRQFRDKLGHDYRRDAVREWDFSDLPESLLTDDSRGNAREAWPGLIDQQDAVGLRLFDTPEEALQEHFYGVLRLLKLGLAGKLRDFRRRHGLSVAASLAWSSAGTVETLVEDLVSYTVSLVAGDRPAGIRDADGFAALLNDARAEIGPVFRKQSAYLDRTLQLWGGVSTFLDDEFARLRPVVHDDLRSQIDDMVYDGFMRDLPANRLEHYPRYLDAMRIRLAGVEKDPARDAERMQQVEPFWQRYLELLERGREYDENVDTYRWLVEEFRVSVFAQQLGTQGRVSVQRLLKAWEKIA